MKRLLYIILVLSMLCCFAACQQTPQSPIVQPKDLERMIEMAVQTPEPSNSETLPESGEPNGGISPLYGRLGVPQTYQVELEPRVEKLSITVDAVVQLPNVVGLPIARVQPTQFTQEQVIAFFNVLCSDTPMYDAGPSGLSRAQLDENILMYQKRVREDSSNKNAKAKLEFLEAQRALEPEDIEERRSSGQLREMIFSTGKPDVGRYMGLSAREYPLDFYKIGKGFSVRNDMDVMDWDDESIDWGEEIGAHMGYRNPANAPDTDGYRPAYFTIADENVVPERAKGQLSITPAQARAQVAALLKQSNSGFLTENVYLFEMVQDQEDGQPVRPSGFSYIVTCGYEVSGVPVRTVTEVNANNYKTETSMAPSWFYERMEWEVTDKGISNFSWKAPMQVTEIVTENAALLPFSDIIEICKRMMLVVHESDVMDYTELVKKEIAIDRIALELQRATEPDAVNGGIVIPVWNFYGNETYQYTFETDDTEDRNRLPRSLLTINAIDGSIIDAQRGY